MGTHFHLGWLQSLQWNGQILLSSVAFQHVLSESGADESVTVISHSIYSPSELRLQARLTNLTLGHF